MSKTKIISSLFLILLAFNKADKNIRLIFEEQKTMRSSFCMYSDGRFFEARPSGCVGQEFASGYWEKSKDTVRLSYKKEDVYRFEILKTVDTGSKFQVVRIIDCYNQPVRFQNVYFDTTCINLYNPGFAKVKKGKSILYSTPMFFEHSNGAESIISNADTITYRWFCNRESIESIDGGTLFINQEPSERKVLLRNKSIIPLSQ